MICILIHLKQIPVIFSTTSTSMQYYAIYISYIPSTIKDTGLLNYREEKRVTLRGCFCVAEDFLVEIMYTSKSVAIDPLGVKTESHYFH